MDVARQEGFRAGRYTVQSESAMLVCKLLAPQKGMRLLDACAAPGGKTAYLSHLLEGEGHIEAWELHPHRSALIQKTLERLHVEGVTVQIRDAAQQDPAKAEAFDAVLVDAPCSGLGYSASRMPGMQKAMPLSALWPAYKSRFWMPAPVMSGRAGP